MMNYLKYTFLFMGALPFLSAMAQERLQEELLLTKPYVPSVNDAVKLDQLPGALDTATIRPNFNYSVTSHRLDGPISVGSLGAAGLQPIITPELNLGYLRLGLGTYQTPMGELSLNTRQKDKLSAGLNLSHLSSGGKVKLDDGHRVFAGYSDNKASGYVKTFFRDFSVSADAGFRRLVTYAYGYDPYNYPDLVFAKKDIRNIYQMGDLNVAVRSLNKDNAGLRYSGTLGLRNTENDFDGRERQLVFAGSAQQDHLGVRISADLLDRSAAMIYDGKALLLGGNPYYLLTNDRMRLEAGVRAQLFKEPGRYTKYKLFPVAEFQYVVLDKVFIPFVGFNGGVRTNSYRSLVEENPNLYQGFNAPTFTNTRFNLYGGMKGSLSTKAQYYFKASYTSMDKDYVYVNFIIPESQNYFVSLPLDYKVLTLAADFSVQASKVFDVTFKGAYHNYHLDGLNHMVDRPEFEASLVARYLYQSRLSVQLDVTAIGNRYVFDIAPDAPDYQFEKKLDGTLNFGLLSEYFVNDRLSVFLKLSNFTTSKYYKWMYYPIQRFQVMGGVTFVF